MYVKLYEISFWKKSKLNQGFLETSKKPWELVSCSVWKAAEVRLISLALQTKTNSIWESNRRIFFIFKNATDWVLSLDRDSIYSYQISYKSPLTVLPFENLYFTESNSYTQLIDCQNFTLKISFAMSTRVCKEHCYRKKAA